MLSFWPFHHHHWVPVASEPFMGVRTRVLCGCTTCGRSKTKELAGVWTLEQIREAWGA